MESKRESHRCHSISSSPNAVKFIWRKFSAAARLLHLQSDSWQESLAAWCHIMSPSKSLHPSLSAFGRRIPFVGLPSGRSNKFATKRNKQSRQKQARNEAAWSDESGYACPPRSGVTIWCCLDLAVSNRLLPGPPVFTWLKRAIKTKTNTNERRWRGEELMWKFRLNWLRSVTPLFEMGSLLRRTLLQGCKVITQKSNSRATVMAMARAEGTGIGAGSRGARPADRQTDMWLNSCRRLQTGSGDLGRGCRRSLWQTNKKLLEKRESWRRFQTFLTWLTDTHEHMLLGSVCVSAGCRYLMPLLVLEPTSFPSAAAAPLSQMLNGIWGHHQTHGSEQEGTKGCLLGLKLEMLF